MSAPRFKVEHFPEHTPEGARWSTQACWKLIDTRTGAVVGEDGGEPEDQLLVRDWAWVPELANALAAQNEILLAALARVGCQDVGSCNAEAPDGLCFVCSAIDKAGGL